MKLYTVNHKFGFELENLTRAFFPNEKIQTISEATESPEAPFVYTEVQGDKLYASVSADGFFEETSLKVSAEDDKELLFATLLYKLFTKI